MKNWLLNWGSAFQFGVITIIIFLFTYHEVGPDFGVGLDTSYVWALNHLFSYNYSRLLEIIYPFGPLAFIKIPAAIGPNLTISLITFSILKLAFISALLKTFFSFNSSDKLLGVILTLIISYFADIDLTILGLCTVLSIQFITKNRFFHFTAAVITSLLGLLIKSSIGVNAFIIVFVSLLIHLYYNKKWVSLIKLLIINFLIVSIIGALVFKDPVLFANYVINVLRLTLGYSSALSIYPENNWIALVIFLMSVFSFPLLIKDKRARIVFVLLLIPLFIIWKHSMSREDLTHNRIMLYFLFFFWGLIIGSANRKSFVLYLLPSISILSFYHNMSVMAGYKGYKIEISGINYFYDEIINFKEFYQKNSSLSAENIKQSIIEPDLRAAIHNSTIDFYPWELSYVPANSFNWQPRKTLQSGSFSHWLDKKSADSFEKNKGPEFIILHYVPDLWGGSFGSIDGRYLLNDEPLTIYKILNNYIIDKQSDRFLLLKKTNSNNLSEPQPLGKIKWKWDEWINVPEYKDDLVRLRFFSQLKTLGKIKELLYKGEAYYIDYQLTNEKIISYRFIPANAKDGLWINPFITSSFTDNSFQQVAKVKFRNSNPLVVRDSIAIQFELIKRIAKWQ